MADKTDDAITCSTALTADNGIAGTEQISASAKTVEKTSTHEIVKWRVMFRLVGQYSAMFSVGMARAIIGAILLEIGYQTGADVGKLSLLFTWSFTGHLASAFIIYMIFDRIHPELQLGLAAAVMMLTTSLIPLTRSYEVVATAIGVQGFCCGYIVTGGRANIFHIALTVGSPGPFLQGNDFAFALGSSLAPLIAKPFLTFTSNSTTSNAQNQSNSTSSAAQNQSAEIENYLDHRTWENNTSSSVSSHFGLIEPGSFYPSMIMVAILVIPIVNFSVQFKIGKMGIRRKHERASVNATKRTTKDITILGLLVLAVFLNNGIEVTFSGLLYTFTIKELNWEPDIVNHVLTVYWVSYMVFRAISIPVVKFLRPSTILAGTISLLQVMLLLLVTTLHVTPVTMWLTSAGMGAATSALSGGWYLLTNQIFPVTGQITGLLQSAFFIGAMTFPAITGYFFKNYGPMSVPYMLIFMSSLMLVLFIAIQICVKIWRKQKTLSYVVVDQQKIEGHV